LLVGLIQDSSLAQGLGDDVVARILPLGDLVGGIDQDVRRDAEIGEATPDAGRPGVIGRPLASVLHFTFRGPLGSPALGKWWAQPTLPLAPRRRALVAFLGVRRLPPSVLCPPSSVLGFPWAGGGSDVV
jgi:hypothetical protein